MREDRRHNAVLGTNHADVLAAMLVHCGPLCVSFVESQKLHFFCKYCMGGQDGRDSLHAMNPSKWFGLGEDDRQRNHTVKKHYLRSAQGTPEALDETVYS